MQQRRGNNRRCPRQDRHQADCDRHIRARDCRKRRAVRSTGADGKHEKAGGDHCTGMEQHEQRNRYGGNQHIVRHRGAREQTPIPGRSGELSRSHPQSDKHHHFDQRDRDQDVDRSIKGHVTSSPARLTSTCSSRGGSAPRWSPARCLATAAAWPATVARPTLPATLSVLRLVTKSSGPRPARLRCGEAGQLRNRRAPRDIVIGGERGGGR